MTDPIWERPDMTTLTTGEWITAFIVVAMVAFLWGFFSEAGRDVARWVKR